MRIVSEAFIIQQQQAADEMQSLVNKLISSGKCIPNIPPDSFIWTGTKEELEKLLAEHAIKLQD